MNLVELAECNNLPEHQFMDEGTINWIETTGKKFLQEKSFVSNDKLSSLSQYKLYFPPKKWFQNENLYQSIHGIRHISRVGVYANILCNVLDLGDTTLNNLLFAISLHDIKRINDKADIGHGARASEWAKLNISLIESEFEISVNPDYLDEILLAIEFHETPYDKIPQNLSEKGKELIDLIKTCDALDRFRLPKEKWWINLSFLKVIPSNSLIQFAYQFVVETEKRYLSDKTEPTEYTSLISKLR